jgi:hypothetical protein
MSIRTPSRPTRGSMRHHWPAPAPSAAPSTGAWVAVMALSLAIGWSPGRGQELPVIDEGMPVGVAGPAPCACRGGQTPPWHGSVAAAPGGWHAPACGPACAPACGPGYGPACGHMGTGCGWWSGRGMGYTLPPFFPRLSTFCREGWLPTPPPVAVPRCHNCGAMIDAGF